jgi:hypothetical protein
MDDENGQSSASTSSTTSFSDLRRFLVHHDDVDDGNEDNGVAPVKVVAMDGKLGRVVVAAQCQTKLGQVLFRETPVLVWNTDGDAVGTWKSYLDAYLAAPDEDKAIILDMFAPPDDSSLVQKLRREAMAICASCSKYTAALRFDMVLKLMTISNINSHEYYGHPSEDFREVLSSLTSRLSSGKAALFVFGSKVAHGCRPNISYTSKTEDGCLEYKVIAPPIESGDILTFAYIDASPASPTHVRRQELEDSKEFFCECSLCVGPDYSRAFKCTVSSDCNGHVTPTQRTKISDPIWSCTVCGLVLG